MPWISTLLLSRPCSERGAARGLSSFPRPDDLQRSTRWALSNTRRTRALYDRQVSPPLRVRLGAVNVLMRIGDDIYNVRGLFCCLAFFKVQSADSAHRHRIALTAVTCISYSLPFTTALQYVYLIDSRATQLNDSCTAVQLYSPVYDRPRCASRSLQLCIVLIILLITMVLILLFGLIALREEYFIQAGGPGTLQVQQEQPQPRRWYSCST